MTNTADWAVSCPSVATLGRRRSVSSLYPARAPPLSLSQMPKRNAASIPATRRHKEKRAESSQLAEAPKKPGNPGHFTGAREAFIDAWYPKFLGVKGSPRKDQNAFWAELFDAYWKLFHWTLPLDSDPDPNTPLPPPENEQTPQDILDKKGEVVRQTQTVRSVISRVRAVVSEFSAPEASGLPHQVSREHCRPPG